MERDGGFFWLDVEIDGGGEEPAHQGDDNALIVMPLEAEEEGAMDTSGEQADFYEQHQDDAYDHDYLVREALGDPQAEAAANPEVLLEGDPPPPPQGVAAPAVPTLAAHEIGWLKITTRAAKPLSSYHRQVVACAGGLLP